MAASELRGAALRAGGSDPQNHERLARAFERKSSRIAASSQRRRLDDVRLRHLAARIHRLGERPLYELFREALDGAELSSRLEVYAALDGDFIAALGGDVLVAPLAVFDGGVRVTTPPLDFHRTNASALGEFSAVARKFLRGGRLVGMDYVLSSPRHSDRSKDAIRVNLSSGRWKDQSSGASGAHLISLVAYANGWSEADATRRLAEFFGLVAPDNAAGGRA